MTLSLASLAVVAATAFLVPLLLALARLRLPESAAQILLGICVGPTVLGWARVDDAVQVFALVGLALLLFLAGLEIEPGSFRGQTLSVTLRASLLSGVLALIAGYALGKAGLTESPLLIAIILSATSLGVVLPTLDDAHQSNTPLGQVIVAGASIAEVVPLVLLSILFSGRGGGKAGHLVSLVLFLILVAVAAVTILNLERVRWLTQTLIALQNTTAQVRVRAALVLVTAFAAVATRFGLEAILGAFVAGVTAHLVDSDASGTHEHLREKLQAVGFGVFVPFFFISTGMTLDVRDLVTSSATVAEVPVFVLALLVVRCLPALLYAPLSLRPRQLFAAGLLQATSLNIPVVGGRVAVQLGLMQPSGYVALVAAGLVSVAAFPSLALPWLTSAPAAVARAGAHADAPTPETVG